MNIEFNQADIKISPKLMTSLKQVITKQCSDVEATQITVNYRDSGYSNKDGGYHPVEIALRKEAGDHWSFLYITDFAYYGFPYAELAKELDFDFSAGQFNAVYSKPRAIEHNSVAEIFKFWQYNFLSYLEYGAFDQIKVSVS